MQLYGTFLMPTILSVCTGKLYEPEMYKRGSHDAHAVRELAGKGHNGHHHCLSWRCYSGLSSFFWQLKRPLHSPIGAHSFQDSNLLTGSHRHTQNTSTGENATVTVLHSHCAWPATTGQNRYTGTQCEMDVPLPFCMCSHCDTTSSPHTRTHHQCDTLPPARWQVVMPRQPWHVGIRNSQLKAAIVGRQQSEEREITLLFNGRVPLKDSYQFKICAGGITRLLWVAHSC